MPSKRFKEIKTKVDRTKVYTLDEALSLLKETSTTKFDSSVEVHVRLGIDPAKSDQQIRATVALPHGSGKMKKVAAFVDSANEKAAKEAGADVIYLEEDIKKLKDTGKIDFDIAVATPVMMPKMAMVAKVLGPKGLMPNPKTDTVGTDVVKMISELKKGKAAFKSDDTANVHQVIGRISFGPEKLKENFRAFIDALKKTKPSSSKGQFLKTAVVASTMGPGIKVKID